MTEVKGRTNDERDCRGVNFNLFSVLKKIAAGEPKKLLTVNKHNPTTCLSATMPFFCVYVSLFRFCKLVPPAKGTFGWAVCLAISHLNRAFG